MAVLRSLSPLLFALCLTPAVLAQVAAPVFTNCLDILKLPPERAREGHSAKVRGVVTCFVPASQLCFIQDATAGLYVFQSVWPKGLQFGSVVEVEGITAQGRFSSILQAGRIQDTGAKATVEPKRVAIEELGTGRVDCHFVELEGVVQAVRSVADVLEFELRTGASSASILLFDRTLTGTNWIDARLRVRGVAGTFYSGEQLTGFGLFVSDPAHVEIISPAADPFTRPLRNIAKIPWSSPEGGLDHRVRINGVVSLAWPEDSFFVQDQGGAIRVHAPGIKPLPAPGEKVEVAGFVRGTTSNASALTGAVWRKIGNGAMPAPQKTGLGELVNNAPKGKVVSTDAQVIGVHTNGDASALMIEQDGRVSHVFCPTPLASDYRGAAVRITGVWSSAPTQFQNESGPGIWVQDTNGITILKAPPAETGPAGRVAPAAAMLGGMVALAAGTFLGWRGRTAQLRAEREKRAANESLNLLERELTQLKEARERLGRDLHDHIIQSIYAVGLNLEDCRQMLDQPGKADPRLGAALEQINEVIRELRNLILGLESNAIQPQEFRTALKSLGLTLGTQKSNRLRLDIDQAAVELLSATQATELIHIAREAMSNSVRHGDAPTTTFGLHNLPEALQFVVEDDGCGFDVATTEHRGYGLRNMAKRAEALGAKFTVEAKKGAGTRIVLDIPKQKQHFSSSESRARVNR